LQGIDDHGICDGKPLWRITYRQIVYDCIAFLFGGCNLHSLFHPLKYLAEKPAEGDGMHPWLAVPPYYSSS